jgi:uncharacterized alpha-E superfamily protein
MLSRVADSIFWMSRYLERIENTARFVDVTKNLSLGVEGRMGPQWAPLVYTTGDHSLFAELYCEGECRPEDYSEDNVLRFLTFEERNPNSILCCLTAARENARSVRENLPTPTWEEINKFYPWSAGPQAGRASCGSRTTSSTRSSAAATSSPA